MKFSNIFKILLCVLALSFSADYAFAAGDGYMKSLEQLRKINSSRPEQGGRHVPSKSILAGRVLDSTNRVVGEVGNVILDHNGAILMLDVNFNRLNFSADSLFVDYRALGVRPATNGYKMSRTDDELAAMLPELLAATSTAAGGDTESVSLKNLAGHTIHRANGKKLGKIQDVLFDSTGARAELLLVDLDQRNVHGETIAIPFSAASFKSKRIEVKQDFAEAMIDYAKTN